MKEILIFIVRGLWHLICEFFRLVKIPLIVVTILIVIGLFIGVVNVQQALIFFCIGFRWIVFPSVFVFYFGEWLAEELHIILKGKKYVGTCTGHIRRVDRFVSDSYQVNWTDDKKRLHHQSFEAIKIVIGYPHPVTVYSLNNDEKTTNLGIPSIIKSLMFLLLFLWIWILNTIDTIDQIYELWKYHVWS